LIRDGIAATDAMGITLLRPTFLAYLAESQMIRNDPRSALETLAQAAERAERTGECCALPEIYRLKAEALLQNGDGRDRAEATLREALAIAQRQHAAGFALRIEDHLGRL